MPETCCVPFCKSRWNQKLKKEDRIRFFEIPANLERREKWLNNIRRKDWVPNDRAKVCEKHFVEDDFQQGLKISRLKPTAVPTVFQDYPVYLQKQLAKKLSRKPPAKRQLLPAKIQIEKRDLRNNGHAQSVQHCVNICLSQGTQTVISQCLPNFESPSQTAMNDLKNDYKQCRRLIAYLRKKNDGLQLKISRLKDTLGKNDKETLVRQVTRIKDDAAKSIPGAVFLLEQLKHYGTKRTHWEKKMLQYCLIWRAKSEQGYSFIRNSQLLKLPDRATLRRHVENEGKKAGISTMYITVHDLPTLDRIVEQSTTVPPTELMFLDDQEDGIPIQLDSINAHSNFLTCS